MSLHSSVPPAVGEMKLFIVRLYTLMYFVLEDRLKAILHILYLE